MSRLKIARAKLKEYNSLDIADVLKSKLSLQEYFIRKTAVLTLTDESITSKIVKDQWEQANKRATANTSISQIEVAGMGVFSVSQAKLKRRLQSLNKLVDVLSADRDAHSGDSVYTERVQGLIDMTVEKIKGIKVKEKNNEH